MAFGPYLVDDAPQTLSFGVVESLGDAESRGIGDHDHEAARQRDLLGEPGALGADGFLVTWQTIICPGFNICSIRSELESSVSMSSRSY